MILIKGLSMKETLKIIAFIVWTFIMCFAIYSLFEENYKPAAISFAVLYGYELIFGPPLGKYQDM